MSRVLYFDASAGVSGDMFVGALLDLGADLLVVRAHLTSLGLPGFEIRARKVKRRGLVGTKFDVLDPETGRDVDAVHGEGSTDEHGPDHGHGHGHDHDHPHDHGHRHDHPAHRGLREIRRLLRGGGLPEAVAADALAVFELMARAEAAVHGVAIEDVHFHEVGALDAIVDIVAAASAFHQLGVDEAWCSPIHVGSGTVRCAHGVLPVPAPATAEILKGAPIYSDGTRGELCTPTGAALVRHFCRGFRALPPLVVEGVGYGAGTKDLGVPNLLRVILGCAAGRIDPPQTAVVR